MRLLSLALLLAACTHAPQAPPPAGFITALSFTGSDLRLDAASSSPLGLGRHLDISAWKLDDAVVAAVQGEAQKRGLEFRALNLDAGKLGRAASARESRFERQLGRYPQALLDHALFEAKAQGARKLVLVLPVDTMERFASKPGPLGLACDGGKGKGRAYVYFEWQVSLWDVNSETRDREIAVDPSQTEALTFADCAVALQAADPRAQFEDPAKRTLARVVESVAAQLFR